MFLQIYLFIRVIRVHMHSRVQLEKFSTRHLSAAGQCSEAQSKMELDSTASSPHD